MTDAVVSGQNPRTIRSPLLASGYETRGTHTLNKRVTSEHTASETRLFEFETSDHTITRQSTRSVGGCHVRGRLKSEEEGAANPRQRIC